MVANLVVLFQWAAAIIIFMVAGPLNSAEITASVDSVGEVQVIVVSGSIDLPREEVQYLIVDLPIEVSGAICELYRGHYVDVTRSEGFDLETAPSLVVVGGVLVSETGPTRLDLTNCLIGNGTQTLVRAVLGDFQGCSETMSLTLSDEKGSLAGMLASGTEASSGSVSRPRVKLEVGSGGDSSDESVPRGLGFECYPNPASGSVTIRLGATDKSNGHRGEVRVFDLRGKLIRTIVAEPRVGAVSWDGNDERGRRMASGVYFVLFNHGVGEVERDRVVLLR